MKEFKVEIAEFLSKVFIVKANTSEEALENLTEMYDKEKIILDSENFVDKEIKIVDYE